MSEPSSHSPGPAPASDPARLPLRGLRVLDLGQIVAGPYGTMLLASLGAEVIKIEPPGRGEPYRREGPRVTDSQGNEHGTYHLRLNRNKKSLALNLRDPRGVEILHGLAAKSDMVWENFRPGVMDRLGVGYQTLSAINPAIIMVSVSGFGQPAVMEGPYADRPAFAIIAEAMGGEMEMVGYSDGPPLWLGFGMADLTTGLMAAFGALAALQSRSLTGRGQHVDCALYDAMVSFSERALLDYTLTGRVPTRGRETYLSSWGAFRCRDGYVSIATVGEEMWGRLCEVIGRPEWLGDPRFENAIARSHQMADVIRPAIEDWLSDRGKQEAATLLAEHGVASGPVQNAADIFNCPQVATRNMLVEVDDPLAGKVQLTGFPVKFSDLPEIEPEHPPLLGEHTTYCLRELLGRDDAAIEELVKDGVVEVAVCR